MSTSPASSADQEPSVSALEPLGGWSALFADLTDGQDLSRPRAEAAMTEILAGQASPVQIAALLIGLRAKGETVDELTGFVTAMLEASERLEVPDAAIDIVGTGGSDHRRRHALNVSTMASIVAASAGAVVCKHGNRRASSTSGSFDFLDALGVAIELDPRQLQACVEEIDLGFAFARAYHPAMRFAGPVRVELGIPTVFNTLGPLANPARVVRQVVGVSSPERARLVAEVLVATGSQSAMVVAGDGGLDELSTTGDSIAVIAEPSGVREQAVRPSELGIEEVTLDRLVGGTAEENVAIFTGILAGDRSPYRDIVLLNAAAGLVVAGVAADLPAGLTAAAAAVDDGAAGAKLDALRTVSNRLAGS
ncbi:MAG: anthranilate phosphoribosyltransferase [Actinomycetota bacterium]